MKNKLILLYICLSFFLTGKVHAQYDFDYYQGNYKLMFIEAESFLLYGDFQEALYLYQILLRQFPNNHNLEYKIGQCLLNISSRKDDAIKMLKNASYFTSFASKDNSYKETRAPIDAFYYLGNAYRVNNELDSAVKYYKRFRELLDPEKYDKKMVDKHIKECETAKQLMKTPVTFKKTNIGSKYNTNAANLNAVISGDENSLVYVTKLKFYDAIFYVTKKDGKWGSPVNIIPQLGIDNNCYPSCLSFDGTELYLYVDENFDGEIYYSKFENKTWSNIVKLNKNINTKYWESHACVSQNGKTLYFSSNREGGLGGLDIYKSEKDSKGEWGIPMNLGSDINTEYNEQTPFLIDNDSKLFFSSEGHINMGGYDIMFSLWTGGKWSTPVNIGYPINTTDDDLFFVPFGDGTKAYYSINDKNGEGAEDIFILEYSIK